METAAAWWWRVSVRTGTVPDAALSRCHTLLAAVQNHDMATDFIAGIESALRHRVTAAKQVNESAAERGPTARTAAPR